MEQILNMLTVVLLAVHWVQKLMETGLHTEVAVMAREEDRDPGLL
jgi:hypothetical protein